MKPKFVYHGSAIKINGELIPKKAKDLAGTVDNSQIGIYASEFKDEGYCHGDFKEQRSSPQQY